MLQGLGANHAAPSGLKKRGQQLSVCTEGQAKTSCVAALALAKSWLPTAWCAPHSPHSLLERLPALCLPSLKPACLPVCGCSVSTMYSQTAAMLESCAQASLRAEGPPLGTQVVALLAERLSAVARLRAAHLVRNGEGAHRAGEL